MYGLATKYGEDAVPSSAGFPESATLDRGCFLAPNMWRRSFAVLRDALELPEPGELEAGDPCVV